MYQIDNSTAATSQPAATTAGTPGFFTDGNPSAGTPATIVPAEWLNAVMMELANVVTGAGLSLNKAQYGQVLAAIRRLAQTPSVLADTGSANAYAASNASPLTAFPGNGFTQTLSIANANTGASTFAPDGLAAKPIYGLGMQPLQGGELVVGGIAKLTYLPAANSGSGAWVLLECTGGALQVAVGSQSNHAANLSQFLGGLSASGYLKMPLMVGGVLRTVIIQWGNANFNASDGNNGTTNVFPIAFPNACLMAVASDLGAAGIGSSCQSFGCGGFGTSSMLVWSRISSSYINASGRFIAIGY